MDWRSDNEYFSSDDNSFDSDIIDSDIEADLYSIIHHQEETSLTNINNSSINENNEINKSNIITNDNDVSGEIYSVNVSKNSQSFVDVKKIKYENELNNGKLTKRKSSVVSDLLNEIQPSTKRIKSKTSTEPNKRLHKDTSDDDSDIICLGSQKEKLQTNLSNNSIFLDCSSDSDDSWCGRLSNNSSTLSNRSSKDLWRINEDDKYRHKRRSRRYHEDEINCSNCNEKGHIARNCSVTPVVKCYFCGRRHNPANCIKRTCAKCFAMGHDSRFCKSFVLRCMLCNMIGHPEHECPDLWRRYHLTTSNDIIITSQIYPEGCIFCYNCGDSGHFGGICRERKLNTMDASLQTWPIVIDYAPPFFTHTSRSTYDMALTDFDVRKKMQQKEKKTMKRERRKLRLFEKRRLRAQQSDFPQTPIRETCIETSPKRSTKSELQEQKRQIREAKHLANKLRKLEALRQKVLSRPLNIPFPLLDFSGRNELPYSYKSLSNRAKRERKRLRDLVDKTYGSNNISVHVKKEK